MNDRRSRARVVLALSALLCARTVFAIEAAPERDSNDDAAIQNGDVSSPDASSTARDWRFGFDGVLFGTFNRQGGRRGDTEFRSQNWLMAMASRELRVGTFTVTGMMSGEPLTAGAAGYSAILQEGEAYKGLQITDRQHPHDLFMQLAAAWRIALGSRTHLTFAGGPVAEPTLGPVPFMHRASASENPIAPLSHHIFDSTHISSGVAMVRLDRGIMALEGSLFRGREKDEHRYNLETGALDSWAMRVWVSPGPAWTIQASHGFLRVENTSVETEILLLPQVVHRPHPGELVDTIRAFTAGAVRDVGKFQVLAIGIGADATFYSVPPLLEVTHGAHPVSFHVFVRVARASLAGRMWNGTMGAHGVSTHEHPHR